MEIEGKIVIGLLERIASALEKANEFDVQRLAEMRADEERMFALQDRQIEEQTRANQAHEEIARRQLDQHEDLASRGLVAQEMIVEATTGRKVPEPARVLNLVPNDDPNGAGSSPVR